jgi:D-amino peptidase
MDILIAADMEGITGVVNWDQVNPNHPEYARFRKLMTADINAAIRGTLEAGADEVFVTDGHANGNNILIEELNPQARLNTGTPSPYAMVQGCDLGLDAALFIGYHARAGTTNAILDHTWSSATVANVWLNNRLVGESGLNAALLGHFNVPVIMISGDEAVCAEALELLGPIEMAAIKKASGRTSAECLPPYISQEKISEAAGRAIQHLNHDKPPKAFKVNTPIELKIEFISSDMTDRASLFPGTRRLDGRRIACTTENMPNCYSAMRTLITLARS